MVIIVAFSLMLTSIFAFVSWNKRMSPYHGLARFGFFVSGFLCIGTIAEIDNVGAIFPLLLLSFGCWFMLYKMFTQV